MQTALSVALSGIIDASIVGARHLDPRILCDHVKSRPDLEIALKLDPCLALVVGVTDPAVLKESPDRPILLVAISVIKGDRASDIRPNPSKPLGTHPVTSVDEVSIG